MDKSLTTMGFCCNVTLQMKLDDAAIPDEMPKVTASRESSPVLNELAISQPGLVQFAGMR